MSRHRRAAALLAVLTILAGCSNPFASSGYEVEVDFGRAFNLFPGSKVRVLGIDVGQVKDLQVEPGSSVARVTLHIDEGVRIPRSARAVIIPQALLGERYIQLTPAYTEGPALEEGAVIPRDRTDVPAEFDEVLESLNTWLQGLDPAELSRLVHNLAEVMDGQGAKLGTTLDSVRQAIAALRTVDDELIGLAARLSDLNETLATRDQELAALIEDWNVVTASLAADRDDIDAALQGLARMARSLGELVETHRPHLEQDVATVTRLGRTAVRNLDQLSVLLDGQAELYRAAERVVDFEQNWLPLVNHTSELVTALRDRINDRLAGLCIRLELELCADPDFWDGVVPDEICVPPLIPCIDVPDPGDPPPSELPTELPTGLPTDLPTELPTDLPTDLPPVPLPEAIEDAIAQVPELQDALEEHGENTQDAVDDVLPDDPFDSGGSQP